MKYQDLFSGLIRLHVLHHASEHPVNGQWLMEELTHHGYSLGSGTIYPLLHSMVKKGYLVSHEEREGRSRKKLYTITPTGSQALKVAQKKVQELHDEMTEEH